jgi:hypothetical protein
MMSQPTKFNDMVSGALNSKPDSRSIEEINHILTARSLSGSEHSEFVNKRFNPTEKPPETPRLPFK